MKCSGSRCNREVGGRFKKCLACRLSNAEYMRKKRGADCLSTTKTGAASAVVNAGSLPELRLRKRLAACRSGDSALFPCESISAGTAEMLTLTTT